MICSYQWITSSIFKLNKIRDLSLEQINYKKLLSVIITIFRTVQF